MGYNTDTNHCTLFWDVWHDYDISGCCLLHDEMYELANVSRKVADITLRDCVNTMTNSSLGDLMYAGVRSFGWIFWLWHRVKQKLGRGEKMNIFDRLVHRIIKSSFEKIFDEHKIQFAKYNNAK